MFTGIIESLGTVINIIPEGNNQSFWIESEISPGLKADQSVNHNGVCLTVEELREKSHRVTAIAETLKKTNLAAWKPGSLVNLERSLQWGDRVDGHLVLGHVDTTATCIKRKEKKGSWEFEFEFPGKFAPLVIEKGSVSLNGISLTVFDVRKKSLRVAIIPYTFEHTNIQMLQPGDLVNLEFDMAGKYIFRYLSLRP